MIDRFASKLQDAADIYADRDYDGLYSFSLGEKTYIARMRSVREGGMREFYDPETNAYLGCCGCDTANHVIKEITYV